MKLLNILLIGFLLVGCQLGNKRETNQKAQNTVEAIREKLTNRVSSSVIVVAHRGDWRNFPENSLAAIDNAIKMGVDIVEIDVQRTKDSVLILMHDKTLERTTTGKGIVSETSYEKIQSLKLKNGCGIRTKHPVPTLEEAFMHAKGKIMLNLDKADRYFDQVFDLMEKTGVTDQIIMKGTKEVEKVKAFYGDYLNKVIYMPVINLDKPNAREQILLFKEALDPVAFELLYKNDSNVLAKEAGLLLKGQSLIWYNTLWDTMAGGHDDDMSLEDLNGGYGYLIDSLGAGIIQTDRPQMLLDYLRDRKLHR
ncbi:MULTISPECIES: glycerophosphodiester phosphodiesterase family protein [unclassified Carboxylicivirga]|uniref:glycerophosphodiester phosphodiesterase family protein n=1 Tax=Carboxylicivirga TaxID=1628153 RepID=UPI003D352AEB